MKKNIIDSATLDIVELITAIADKVCHIKFDNDVLEKITIDAIKQLKSTCTLPTFVTVTKNTAQIRDTSMLNTEQPTIKDILKYDTEIKNEETKTITMMVT